MKNLQRAVTAAIFLSAGMVTPWVASGADLPVIELNAGIHVIRAEVAYTYASRARGLMRRDRMQPNQGMLFVFRELDRPCMWMKNTLIPLSVAFMDDAGTIINIEDMSPQTENSHCAGAPARFALEMNLGWFKKRGLGSGAKLQGIDRAPAPQ